MLLDQINKMKFDVRMVENNLKKNFVTKAQYTQHLNDLPEEQSDNVEFSKLSEIEEASEEARTTEDI